MDRLARIIAVAVSLGLAAAPTQSAATWADWPPGPRDSDLEAIVRAAYAAAAAYARSSRNYFARDDDTAPLQRAIAAELSRQGYPDVMLVEETSPDPDQMRRCTADGTTLRFAVNMFGDGISLAAASPRRVFSYRYEPHEEPGIAVREAEDCPR